MYLKQIFKLFQAGTIAPKEPMPMTSSFSELETVINKTAILLFSRYRSVLLQAHASYIVQAIWGKETQSVLDPTQTEIHKMLEPVIQGIIDEYSTNDEVAEQLSGFEYILRGLFLYKIAYMIQIYDNNTEGKLFMRPNVNLENMETIGKA